MNVTCNARERIFEDGTGAEWEALEAHAVSCARCAEEVRAWKSLSTAAQELQDYSPSPSLWPRIERALAEEAARKAQHPVHRGWLSFLPVISLGWQTALAGAFVLILAISAGWVYIVYGPNVKLSPPDPSLLKSAALKEVESTETAYERAIDKLAAQPGTEVTKSQEGDTQITEIRRAGVVVTIRQHGDKAETIGEDRSGHAAVLCQ